MASLTGNKIKDTYQSLLKTDDNGLVTSVFKNITDGSGSSSGLYLKNNGVYISGSLVLSGSLLYSGSTINATVTSASHALTASYALNGGDGATDTGSLLVTASVSSNTITFTKGDSTTFTVTVDTGSAVTTDTGSLLVTASVSSNTITFTKGDSTTFDITVDTGSATPIDTSSFATTGSNTFNGNQTISGSINFGDGSEIQSVSASAGDGSGLTTLTLKPDTSNPSDQYIVLDPTSPNHIHIRAGGIIDSSSAYLYLGGEKSNVVVRNLDNSFNEKHWVQINSQTGSTQYTWIFDDDGTLSVPGDITGAGNLATTGSNQFNGNQGITGSLEQGSGVVATGSYSHAEGNITQAIGDYSHAEGDNTRAIGNYSHAEGQEAISVGNYSHAEGYDTRAIGDRSHAEGAGTKTGTQNAYYAESVVNGVVTLSGSYGDIPGFFVSNNKLYLYDTPFDNNYGRSTYLVSQSYFDSTNTIVELYNTGVNTTKAYIGDTRKATDWMGDQIIPGDHAHSEGTGNIAVGIYSHTEGINNSVIGNAAHAEGNETQAIGEASHAEGRATTSIGNYSHAEGQSTQAIGHISHAEGAETQAIGLASHAEGYYTIASGSYQHVSGQYNQHNNDTSYFVVGIGLTEETRKDGFTVDVDANGSGSVMIPNNLDAPSVAKTGSMYVDPANNKLWIYTGNGGVSGWVTSSLG